MAKGEILFQRFTSTGLSRPSPSSSYTPRTSHILEAGCYLKRSAIESNRFSFQNSAPSQTCDGIAILQIKRDLSSLVTILRACRHVHLQLHPTSYNHPPFPPVASILEHATPPFVVCFAPLSRLQQSTTFNRLLDQ